MTKMSNTMMNETAQSSAQSPKNKRSAPDEENEELYGLHGTTAKYFWGTRGAHSQSRTLTRYIPIRQRLGQAGIVRDLRLAPRGPQDCVVNRGPCDIDDAACQSARPECSRRSGQPPLWQPTVTTATRFRAASDVPPMCLRCALDLVSHRGKASIEGLARAN